MPCLSAEIAGASGDLSYDALDAIWVTHDIAQIGLDIGRQNNEDEINDLSFSGDYWLNGAFQKELVFPHTYERGYIHFKVEESEVLKIDIPIGYRIFTYRFEKVVDNLTVEKEL